MKRRIWLWFIVGFVTTFLLMLTLNRVVMMLPSGDAVVSMTLWQYYLREWPRFELIGDPMPLGPATGANPNVVMVTLQHLALSAIAGALTATVGWWMMRRRLAP